MMKKPNLQMALLVFAFLSRAPFASADPTLPRLRLEAESLSSLQSHSGQRVILIGYFKSDFEVSDLFPTKDQTREMGKHYFDRTVWVGFAKDEDWKFFGLPFSGPLEIEGVLKAEPGGQYGHLGGCDAELTDSRIRGLLPRQFGVFSILFVASAGVIAGLVRKMKKGSR